MAARAKKITAANSDLAPSGKPWSFGIRTWNSRGCGHGEFQWALEIGARTKAPDWKPKAECGNGLHCNPEGMGDWSLLSESSDAITGVVRYDPDLAIDLEGKIKAPWMEIVMTTKTHSYAQIMEFIAVRTRTVVTATIVEAMKDAKTPTATKEGESAVAASGHASAAGYRGHASAAGDRGHASAAGDRGHASAAGDSGHASAAGYSGHASAAGYRGHASAAGYRGHASAAGDRGHASAAGYSSIAAALGIDGTAQANASGAIMLAAYELRTKWTLVAVFAGMVGQTYSDVTIKPNTTYRLGLDGVPVEVVS